MAILLFITLIGIPFGVQHLKLVGISHAPIVTKEVAEAARKANGEEKVKGMRGN